MSESRDPVLEVLGRLQKVSKCGPNQWSALCPAHTDNAPSLSISKGEDGRVLLHCHAGCALAAIVSALQLAPQDLFPEKPIKKRRGKIVATYDYRDESGQLLFQTVRFDPKDFSQRRPDGQGGWIWNLKDTPRVLYRLPELIAADPNQWVCICEGERDVDRLVALGFIATCNPLGAGKWPKLASDAALDGRRVVIFPDEDDPGRAHVHIVATRISGQTSEVRVVAIPDGFKDISAWCDSQAGTSPEQLRQQIESLIENATPWVVQSPPATTANESGEPQSQNEVVELGQRDPQTGKLVLSPRKTLPSAETFVREFHFHDHGRTIHGYGGQFLSWRGNCYREVEDGALRHQIQPWLHNALRYVQPPGAKSPSLVPFESNPTTVNNVLETLRGFTHLSGNVQAPTWLDETRGNLDPREILTCQSMNLHLPTGKVIHPTPLLFAINALEFDHDPKAKAPATWLNFLEQLWGDDLEQIELVQDWFGYSLTADTRQQKMLLLVGPRRSGKGTIARVLAKLVGTTNVCGPTTSSLAGPFGLQPLLGKSLAIISDARFTGRDLPIVVERLLCISGEDAVTVDRKFLTSLTTKLPTRFMFLSNELPRLTDASGALIGRFVVARMTESFYGKEDLDLTQKLHAELPGILNWAIDGWKRLNQRGRFHPPSSTSDAIGEMEELSSPVLAFVRDRCSVHSDDRVGVDDIYQAWKEWCEIEGRESPGPKTLFGRNLLAAFSTVRCRRGTDGQRFYSGIGLVPANL